MTTEEFVESHKTTENTSEKASETSEMVVVEKLKGFDFWKNALKSAKYVVAPMVPRASFFSDTFTNFYFRLINLNWLGEHWVEDTAQNCVTLPCSIPVSLVKIRNIELFSSPPTNTIVL